MRNVVGTCCEVELEVVSEVDDLFIGSIKRTKRAFWRHVETSSGKCSETVGFVLADCCQLRGGCASAIVCLCGDMVMERVFVDVHVV